MTDNVGTSRLFSTFSLRPPLPEGKTDSDIAAGTVRKGANEIEKESPETVQASSSDGKASLSSGPPAPFLCRMYVACHVLRLATETRFTALVLLHRYAQAKQRADIAADTTEDWPWVGAVCIFLACKSENEPRRLRDIINMAQMVLPSSTSNNDTSTTESAADDSAKDSDLLLRMEMTRTPPLDGAYWDSKKKAIETEQMVLRWLGFDCSVSHPHKAVFWILDRLMTVPDPRDDYHQRRQEPGINPPASRKRKHSKTAPSHREDEPDDCVRDELELFAFQRLNDALFYPRALRWGVVEMACAAIDLAIQDHTAADGNAATIAKDGMTGQTPEKNISLDAKTTNKKSGSSKSIFKRDWWKIYGISSKDFDGCRKNLEEATSYLRVMAATKK